MNVGSTIDFFNKRAEELKQEEKPVSAPKVDQTVTTKTEGSQTVESDKKHPVDDGTASASEKENTTEKSAQHSAKDLADAISSLKKPTGTGIAAGAGLGTILATLGALHRSNGGSNSFLSNPLLLGALGAAGGYIGGNMLERQPVEKPVTSREGWGSAGDVFHGISSVIGLNHLAKSLEDPYLHGELINARDEWKDFARSVGLNPNKSIKPSQLSRLDAGARNRYSVLVDRLNRLTNEQKSRSGKGSSLLGFGTRVKAINPLRKGFLSQLGYELGLNEFRKIKGNTLSSRGMDILSKVFARKHLPNRLALLAPLVAGGHFAYRAMTKDKPEE